MPEQLPPVIYNLCEFPDPWHDDQFSDYLHALVDVNQNIPDRFDLTTTLAQTADRSGVGPEALKGQLRLIRLAGMLAWLPPLALLLLIAAVIVRTLGRWIGLPLIVGGLLAALLALALRATITGVLGSGVLSETPALLQQEAARVVLRLADMVFNPMLIQSVVIVALGVLMLLWYMLKGRQRPGAPAASRKS